MTKSQIGYLLLTGLFALNLLFTVADKSAGLLDEVEVSKDRIYEMRTYTTHPGKLDDLHTRFRDHSVRILAKHGMTSIAYWVPVAPDLRENTLVYVLSHESRESAERSWDAFQNDPEWQAVYEASHADGVIVSRVESVFMKATSYSQIR